MAQTTMPRWTWFRPMVDWRKLAKSPSKDVR
jgi:hypothetical protein